MKIKLDEKESLLITSLEPKGKNGISSKQAFLQGKLYHQKSHEHIKDVLTVQPVNFNYDNLFYGRLDKENEPVFLDTNISQINNFKSEVLNLNFVVDAFNDFFSHWNTSIQKGRISEDGIFYTIKSINGYIEPIKLYQDYFNQQYEYFLDFLNKKGVEKEILNFEHFFTYFVQFIERKVGLLPFTFSSFCISKFSSPRITGLVFEIGNDNKTKDEGKYKNYLKDINYPFFHNSAANYGFIIDKKVPWRMIADLDSTKMKAYMKKYLAENTEPLSAVYKKCYSVDLELLKNNVVNFFEMFIENNREVVVAKSYICKSGNYKVKNFLKIRDIKLDDNMNQNIFRFYVFLKARENNVDWTQKKFESVVKKAYTIYSSVDKAEAMRYIHASTNFPIVDNRQNKLFSF